MGLSFESDRNVVVSELNEMGIANGLILYYNMDTIGSTIIDNAGINNPATNYGVTSVPGLNGNAASFNGTNQYIKGTYPSCSTLSLTCWSKNPTGAGHIVSLISNSQAVRVAIKPNGYNFTYLPETNSSWEYSIPNDNTWYFSAITYDGTQLKLYANYTNIYTQNLTLIPYDGDTILVGKSYNGGYIGGYVDDVRVYNRALSAAEIKQLYKLNAPNNVASMKENQ